MKTSGLTTSISYQNYLASKVEGASTALINAEACDSSWEFCLVSGAAAETKVIPAKPSKMIVLHGLYSTWMLINGYLTYSAYNTFATTLNTNNVSTKTLWTTSWLKSSTPISVWFAYSYAVMFMNGMSVIGFLAQLKGGPSTIFFRLVQASLVWPIITIPLYLVTLTKYSDCSTLSSANFTGTSTAAASTTQYTTCKSGTTASFGATGTIAKSVTTDPYSTWWLVNGASSLLQAGQIYFTYGKMAPYFIATTINSAPPP